MRNRGPGGDGGCAPVDAVPPRRWHLGLVATAAVTVWLLGSGRLPAALALIAVAVLAHHARSVAPAAAATIDRTMKGAWHATGQALMALFLGVVFVLVVLPLSVVAFPFRPRTMGQPRGFAGWVARASTDQTHAIRRPHGADHRHHVRPPADDRAVDRAADGRPSRIEAAPRPRTVGRTVGRVAGIILLFALLDLAAGAALSGSRLLIGDRAGLRQAQLAGWRETMSSPAIRDEPWAEQYGEDQDALARRPQQYVPFLLYGFQEYHSRWVNTSDAERRSYVPDTDPAVRPLRVAFFGGSVMFGIGQRDEHTIPSQFARLAEQDGVPVEVHNYGMYGWVRWQQYQYLERLLARGERYDLVVFYDGLNDFMVQFSDPAPDPTHGGSRILGRVGNELHHEQHSYPGYLDGFADLAATYRENSGIARVVDRIVNGDPTVPDWVQGTEPVDSATASAAALDIYARAGRAVTDLAADHDIPVRFYLQATQIDWTPEQLAQLPPGTGDYSDVFDGIEPSVYVDGAHTNERGARLVAERMWRELGPELTAANEARDPAG